MDVFVNECQSFEFAKKCVMTDEAVSCTGSDRSCITNRNKMIS